MELALVRAFGWSLRDIDETDIESLLPFIGMVIRKGQEAAGEVRRMQAARPKGRKFADEVGWLN